MVFILPLTISNKQSDLSAKNLLWVANMINLLGFICLFKISKTFFAVSKSKILLQKVGLTNRSNHYPSQLSGGEKQRVSIARALINDPQIILADEPTGSLDLKTAKNVFEILKKQINTNRLIIFATHNRFFANKSDCLLEMVDGNIKTING